MAIQVKYLVNIYKKTGLFYAQVLERKDQTTWPTVDGKYFIAGKVQRTRRISEPAEAELSEANMNIRQQVSSFTHFFANKKTEEILISILKHSYE